LRENKPAMSVWRQAYAAMLLSKARHFRPDPTASVMELCGSAVTPVSYAGPGYPDGVPAGWLSLKRRNSRSQRTRGVAERDFVGRLSQARPGLGLQRIADGRWQSFDTPTFHGSFSARWFTVVDSGWCAVGRNPLRAGLYASMAMSSIISPGERALGLMPSTT